MQVWHPGDRARPSVALVLPVSSSSAPQLDSARPNKIDQAEDCVGLPISHISDHRNLIIGMMNAHSSQPNAAAAYTNSPMCLSPPPSMVQVFDSLSPPPTPGRQRFSVHNEPTPLFFPASASLIHNASGKRMRITCDEEEILELIESRPVPRPTFKRRVSTDQQRIDFYMLPPLPFDFTSSTPKTRISGLPSLSDKSGRDGKVLERGLSLKPQSINNTSLTGGPIKLLPFRRSGVSNETRQRRNSLAAKTA